jgi:hypothetical protein
LKVSITAKYDPVLAVYRLSLGGGAAYLHAEMQTSIASDSPHDNGPDEQCQAQVKGQCREKRRKNTSGQHQHTMSQRSVDRPVHICAQRNDVLLSAMPGQSLNLFSTIASRGLFPSLIVLALA